MTTLAQLQAACPYQPGATVLVYIDDQWQTFTVSTVDYPSAGSDLNLLAASLGNEGYVLSGTLSVSGAATLVWDQINYLPPDA